MPFRGLRRPGEVTLAAGWLALALLMPAGINFAVKDLAPMPSRIELILALRQATDVATAERSKLIILSLPPTPAAKPAISRPCNW
jgi:ABC-2 type transport system permease protein